MRQYKVRYTYTFYGECIHGQRVSGWDLYEADSAQDAVDQCRDEFYLGSELKVESVSIWSLGGYWLPVSAWM